MIKKIEICSLDERKDYRNDCPRTKKFKNKFYQNIDELIDFRCKSEEGLNAINCCSNFINISNPKGRNIMKLVGNRGLWSYKRMISRLNSLLSRTM